MKMRINTSLILFPMLLGLTLPCRLNAQFTFVTNNGTITITGYTGSGGDVVIPDEINGLPVTQLAGGAFHQCIGLTAIKLGANVAFFEPGPFTGCSGLKEITVDEANSRYASVDGVLVNKTQTALLQFPGGKEESTYLIPNTVTHINGAAFCYSLGLTNVVMPPSVRTLGSNSFGFCTNLTRVAIGSNVTNIGIFSFFYCTALPSVTIPDSVQSIGGNAFGVCTSLTNVVIGRRVS